MNIRDLLVLTMLAATLNGCAKPATSVRSQWPAEAKLDSKLFPEFQHVAIDQECTYGREQGRVPIGLTEEEMVTSRQVAAVLLKRLTQTRAPIESIREAVKAGLPLNPIVEKFDAKAKSNSASMERIDLVVVEVKEKWRCRRLDTNDTIDFIPLMAYWAIQGRDAKTRWPEGSPYFFFFVADPQSQLYFPEYSQNPVIPIY